jgi:hypothetical protein
MQLIREISHDSNVVGNSPVSCWQNAVIEAVQEMAEAFLVREFKGELSYKLICFSTC